MHGITIVTGAVQSCRRTDPAERLCLYLHRGQRDGCGTGFLPATVRLSDLFWLSAEAVCLAVVGTTAKHTFWNSKFS